MVQHLRETSQPAPTAFVAPAAPIGGQITAPGPGTRRPGVTRKRIVVLLALLAAGAAIAFYWWQHRAPPLPAGIVYSNGRIEADEIDIETKFAGRVAAVLVDEGDTVVSGQVVARMDTRDTEAALHRDEATASQAEKTLDEVRATITQQQTQVELARKQISRTQSLLQKDFATHERYDQQKQQLDGALASVVANTAKLAAAEQTAAAARHQVELDRANVDDNTLVAPKDGRIAYRISNVGEVLGAGGKVFTMLDLSYVYMDVYLPTADAGRVRIGGDARIVLDARPDTVIPAKITFLATQAQFTPKSVETKNERDKLMFRVRVRLDPETARAFIDRAGTGLPGMAYIRVDPSTAWPAQLQPKS